MKRLTERASDCVQLKECGNSICMVVCNARRNCSICPIEKAHEKLADYEDTEEQGLLVKLPTKIGGTVYRINRGSSKPIIDMKVVQIDITENSCNIWTIDRDYGELAYSKERIGISIFLTREEAEKKLEEMKNGR